MIRGGTPETTRPEGIEIAVVVAHPAVRALIVDLLERTDPTWWVTASADSRPVAARLGSDPPAVVVVDAADVAQCCRATFAAFPRERLIVIGPQPGDDYEQAAGRTGVGAWLPRDHIGDDLPELVRAAAGHHLASNHQGGTT